MAPFRSVLSAVLAAAMCVCHAHSATAPAPPLTATPTASHDALAGFIAEAARRFGVPEGWLRAVIRVESAGQVRARSHAGAMGLMQVMPQTYAELRARYRLGPDPYAPRDNILAGAAYLRELFDRFGADGFLAAYNAGPGRYLEHVVSGRPLPGETRRYVAKLAPALGLRGAAPTVTSAPLDELASSRRSSLFAQPAGIEPAEVTTADTQPERSDGDQLAPIAGAGTALFVGPWGEGTVE